MSSLHTKFYEDKRCDYLEVEKERLLRIVVAYGCDGDWGERRIPKKNYEGLIEEIPEILKIEITELPDSYLLEILKQYPFIGRDFDPSEGGSLSWFWSEDNGLIDMYDLIRVGLHEHVLDYIMKRIRKYLKVGLPVVED